jgi:hypothetical protein
MGYLDKENSDEMDLQVVLVVNGTWISYRAAC